MTTHELALNMIESLPYAPEVETEERPGRFGRMARRRRDEQPRATQRSRS